MEAATDTYRTTVVKAKRQAILKAARAQFLKCGYTHAGMTDIACDADVSTATLYKHFRSKEILFAEIVEQASDHFKFDFPQPVDGASLEDSFCVAAKTGLKSFLASDVQPLMRIVIGEVPFAPELARETFKRVTHHWYNATIGALDDMIAQGYLKPHDTSISARFLIGMIKEIFIWDGLFHANHVAPTDDDGRKIRTLVELFLHRYSVNSPDTKNVVWLRS
ncbi:MAG: TetR/AcrR family transcriptional regulator [Parvibaculum sp.]|nr:TetR/AcrR family transcriptional regulator [Parvibaculum sp.]|tara:strand:+ start:847 stop:1509 length:663 start_codon:yes stop_codon:yes gene_type:complete